jgi:hypothetical protein
MSPGILPESQERRIVAHLYEDAQRIGWTYATQADRTRQYSEWMKDPEVGGLLITFMSPEDARVWIKDGPMKEYTRAVAGIGKYADLVSDPRQGAAAIVCGALGSHWSVVPGTLQVKPLQCVAAHQELRTRVVWGPTRDFKHVLYAGLEAAVNGDNTPIVLVVTDTMERPLSAGVREYHRLMSERCGLRTVHLRV